MAEASLLKLELYMLIEKQKLRLVIQKKLLACYLGCIFLVAAGGLIGLIPWHASILAFSGFVGLFFWGKHNLEKNRYELKANQQALKDVYAATEGRLVSSEEIEPR